MKCWLFRLPGKLDYNTNTLFGLYNNAFGPRTAGFIGGPFMSKKAHNCMVFCGAFCVVGCVCVCVCVLLQHECERGVGN